MLQFCQLRGICDSAMFWQFVCAESFKASLQWVWAIASSMGYLKLWFQMFQLIIIGCTIFDLECVFVHSLGPVLYSPFISFLFLPVTASLSGFLFASLYLWHKRDSFGPRFLSCSFSPIIYFFLKESMCAMGIESSWTTMFICSFRAANFCL